MGKLIRFGLTPYVRPDLPQLIHYTDARDNNQPLHFFNESPLPAQLRSVQAVVPNDHLKGSREKREKVD